MLRIRVMTAHDMDLGLRLKDQAGWNQTPADWRRFLELEPEGCFVAEWNGRPVGTTTTCVLGAVGWIAMVLVEESARHQGIGTRLVRHAVDHLAARGVRTLRLDATALGRPVYERLGFVADYELVRLQGIAREPGCIQPGIERVEPAGLGAIARLDESITGTQRHRLLERLLAEAPQNAGSIARDGNVGGYVLWRDGSRAITLGPAVAMGPPDGAALLDWALGRCRGQPVFVDVPADNPGAMDWGRSRGLEVQRRFLRMRLGPPVPDDPGRIWASSGPEKG